MRPAKHLALATALTALCAAGPAAAQNADLAQAKKWFNEAAAADKKGDCRTAVELYRKALAVKETPQLHLRVGTCQDKLGDLAGAEASYEKAVARAEQAGAKDALDVAKEELEKIRPRVPRVTFTMTAPPADLALQLDGQALAASSLETALPLNPGEHRVVAESGKARFDKGFTLAERERITIPIDLPGATSAAPQPVAPEAPTTPPEGDTGGGANVPAIALLAGGGAALVGGVVLVIVSFAKDSSIDDDCGGPDRPSCPESAREDIESRIDSVNLFRGLGFGLAGAGLVAAGIGTTLLVTSSTSAEGASEGTEQARAATTRAHVRIAPSVGPRSVWLGASGRF